jgi:phosphoglycolate phosphatase
MLIAFDFDGVIVDSLEFNMNAVNKAGSFFSATRKTVAQDVHHTEDMSFVGAAKSVGIAEAEITAFVKKVFEVLISEPDDTKIFEKIPDVIQTLAQNHQIAIITSNVKTKVEQILDKHNLRSNILEIVDGSNHSPKSEKIRQIAAKFQVDTNETIMIGDSLTDIREGKLAGAKTIAVAWGFQPLSVLSRANPDYIANIPEDILSHVKHLQTTSITS